MAVEIKVYSFGIVTEEDFGKERKEVLEGDGLKELERFLLSVEIILMRGDLSPGT